MIRLLRCWSAYEGLLSDAKKCSRNFHTNVETEQVGKGGLPRSYPI